MSVSRQKYEKVKDAAVYWNESYTTARNEIKTLVKEVAKWKKCSENLPDQSTVDELESIVRSHKKERRELEEKFRDRIYKLEREKLLLEGKNQQLEEAKTDLKERYTELKEDYREQQRWNREVRST